MVDAGGFRHATQGWMDGWGGGGGSGCQQAGRRSTLLPLLFLSKFVLWNILNSSTSLDGIGEIRWKNPHAHIPR